MFIFDLQSEGIFSCSHPVTLQTSRSRTSNSFAYLDANLYFCACQRVMINIQEDSTLSDVESVDEQKWDDRFEGLCLVLKKGLEEQPASYNTEEEQREYGFEPWYEKDLDTDLEKKAKLKEVDDASSVDRDSSTHSPKSVITTQAHDAPSSSSSPTKVTQATPQPSLAEQKGMQTVFDASS